jgi:hypothetical protein
MEKVTQVMIIVLLVKHVNQEHVYQDKNVPQGVNVVLQQHQQLLQPQLLPLQHLQHQQLLQLFQQLLLHLQQLQ